MKRTRFNALLGAAVVTLAGISLSPAANAAYTSYFNGSVAMGAEKQSTTQSSLIGGRVQSPGYNGPGTLHITSFHPAPGYREVASTSGGAGDSSWVSLSHAKDTNVNSKCSWNAGSNIGPMKLSCQYNK
ncbi:hypothetical protein [Ancrocorticia populi]|uniref:hypothetical protein n=1 Tax=Ancrocorticia populi TaxID=2175228 RepID=UPI001057B480|nr:hypothetical protein [Ancrocorticia populi]MDN6486300.1 hypothetical protein [Ancrocorticia sp.]